jgi:CRP/FNR family transcriptional regulator, cyclic AMP receptor protein
MPGTGSVPPARSDKVAEVTEAVRPTANVCHVLREDPELADGTEPELLEEAVETLIAREVEVPPGPWRPRRIALNDGLGLLVLEGMLLHRVGIEERFGAELLGQGDVMRSAHAELAPFTLTLSNDWQVLEPTRLAVLDERFVRRMARFPQVASRLFARAILRSRQLVVNMAIVHQARVDVRLHMLLWQLAGRWGRVRTDGVVLPVRLTHAVLADLVAARRPTVTSALSDLARRGAVKPIPDGWLLHGRPPGEPPEGRFSELDLQDPRDPLTTTNRD